MQCFKSFVILYAQNSKGLNYHERHKLCFVGQEFFTTGRIAARIKIIQIVLVC